MSDWEKLAGTANEVQQCLKSAQADVEYNNTFPKKIENDPEVKKSCERRISRKARVDVLDPIFGGRSGCAGFFDWLRTGLSCDTPADWVLGKVMRGHGGWATSQAVQRAWLRLLRLPRRTLALLAQLELDEVT